MPKEKAIPKRGSAVCEEKHTKADECGYFPNGIPDQATLRAYAKVHPAKGGVNFNKELSAFARSQKRSWSY